MMWQAARRLWRMSSAGRFLFASMPPDFPAAKKTYAGRAARKKRSTSSASV